MHMRHQVEVLLAGSFTARKLTESTCRLLGPAVMERLSIGVTSHGTDQEG
jgi:hypothetical protein